MTYLIFTAIMLAICGFCCWLGWDSRGDYEDNKRWDNRIHKVLQSHQMSPIPWASEGYTCDLCGDCDDPKCCPVRTCPGHFIWEKEGY